MTSPSLSIKTYPSILLLEPIYIYMHGREVTKGEVAPLALNPVYSVLLCNSVRKRNIFYERKYHRVFPTKILI